MDSLAVFVKLEGWKVYIKGGTNLPMPKIGRERPQGTFDSASGSDGNPHPGRPELRKPAQTGPQTGITVAGTVRSRRWC